MQHTTKMVGPLPGPCVCGSFSAPGCPLLKQHTTTGIPSQIHTFYKTESLVYQKLDPFVYVLRKAKK